MENKITYDYTSSWKRCQNHPELKLGKGILTGGRSQEQKKKADMLVLLDNMGFPDYLFDSEGRLGRRQRVVHFPIKDMGIPGAFYMRKFDNLIEIIIRYLKDGKRVHISCIGGHGRTGTVLSVIVGLMLRVDDPVEYIRSNYCKEAVESLEQHDLVAKLTGTKKPDKSAYFKAPIVGFEGNKYSSNWESDWEWDNLQQKFVKKGGEKNGWFEDGKSHNSWLYPDRKGWNYSE